MSVMRWMYYNDINYILFRYSYVSAYIHIDTIMIRYFSSSFVMNVM